MKRLIKRQVKGLLCNLTYLMAPVDSGSRRGHGGVAVPLEYIRPVHCVVAERPQTELDKP
jgi:hypothetical protein